MTKKQLVKKIIKGIKFRMESRLLSIFALYDYIRSKKNSYKEPSMCAFYQCHRRPQTVISALSSFRRIYPNGKIHLFCDEGDDMSNIAKYFDCEYEYMTKKTGSGGTLFFQSKGSVLFYLDKLVFAAKNSTEDFLMILEDDTKVYKKIKDLRFDWNSTKANHHYSGRKLTSILRSRNKSIPWYIPNMYFAGSGGAMLNREFLVEYFSDREKLDKVIDELSPYIMAQWPGALPQDAILTALVLYFGGTVGMYPGFAEVQYPRYKLRPLLGRVDVVHNDKSSYQRDMTEEERKIFSGQMI